MKSSLFKPFGALLLVALCVSCNRQKPDPKEAIYALIDQGNTAEAVQKAQGLYDESPSDDNRLILASALVAQAGINVRESLPKIQAVFAKPGQLGSGDGIQPTQADSELNGWISNLASKNSKFSFMFDNVLFFDKSRAQKDDIRKDLGQADAFLGALQRALKAIPDVEPKGISSLQQAYTLLKSSDWKNQKRAAAYSAYISLVFIKDDLHSLSDIAGTEMKPCAENVQRVAPVVQRLLVGALNFTSEMKMICPAEDQAMWDNYQKSVVSTGEVIERVKNMEFGKCD
jgi:hypothetical protein